MGYNAKRIKNVSSMKKVVSLFMIFLFVTSCKIKEKKIFPKLPFELLMTDVTIEGYYQEKNEKGFFRSDTIAFDYDFFKNLGKDIELIKGHFILKKNKQPFVVTYAYQQHIYDPYKTTDVLLKNRYLQLKNKYKNIDRATDSIIAVTPEKMLPEKITSIQEIFTTKEFFFDDSLNIDGKFKTYNYETTFKKGSGYWKDFYNEGAIKEEGFVQNNYKVGQWKYYNKNGTIDSLKTYSIKDNVDVRFPHCLLNKNEPCY